MRDRDEIKAEIDEAQHNLEQNLGELKDALIDKVDVPAKLEREYDKRKEQLAELVDEGAKRARELYAKAVAFARKEPYTAAGIAAGVGFVLVAALVVRSRRDAD